MLNLFKRATALSSGLSGVYSGAGFIFIMYIKYNYDLTTSEWNQFAGIASIVFFLFPFTIFVTGIEFLSERMKNITLTFFIFPSSKNDLRAFGRMLIWFITTGIIFLTMSGLTNS